MTSFNYSLQRLSLFSEFALEIHSSSSLVVPSSMITWKLSNTVLLLSCLIALASSQLANNCSCSPLVYEWTFNFSQSCSSSQMNIESGPMTGIESASCEIIDSSILSTQTISDYIPVAVKSFQIIELDTNLFPVSRLISLVVETIYPSHKHVEHSSRLKVDPTLLLMKLIPLSFHL